MNTPLNQKRFMVAGRVSADCSLVGVLSKKEEGDKGGKARESGSSQFDGGLFTDGFPALEGLKVAFNSAYQNQYWDYSDRVNASRWNS